MLNPNYYATGVSGISDEDVLRGRPYGGCAIFLLRNTNVQIVFTNSSRICVSDTVKLLFINVYLPHEDGGANSDELKLQRSIIDDIVEQNEDCDVIHGGEPNVDISRN